MRPPTRSPRPAACTAILFLLILVSAALLPAPAAAADAAKEAGWEPLVDEASIATWTQEGQSPASYRLNGTTLIGQPLGNDTKNAFLCSPRTYEDFDLRWSFRIRPQTMNSGVQFRSESIDGTITGPQVEMMVEDRHERPLLYRWGRALYNFWSSRNDCPGWCAAGIYGENLDGGWIYPGPAGGDPRAFFVQGRRLTKPDGWNEVRLEASGPHIRTWLNGEPRADFISDESLVQPGKICLQVHGGQFEDPSRHTVEWRGLEIRER